MSTRSVHLCRLTTALLVCLVSPRGLMAAPESEAGEAVEVGEAGEAGEAAQDGDARPAPDARPTRDARPTPDASPTRDASPTPDARPAPDARPTPASAKVPAKAPPAKTPLAGKTRDSSPVPPVDPRAPRDGWHPAIRGAFNLSFSYSDGVVGVTDGVGLSLGVQLDAELTRRRGPHEWTSRLYLVHTQTKTASIRQFVKSVDQFFLQSTYQFRVPVQRWIGVFALMRVSSELFPGELVRSRSLSLELHENDGSLREASLPAQTPFRLTDAFLPLFFKQYLGLLLLPLDWRAVRIRGRLGVSAWQVWTGQGYIADDDVDTEDRYELRQLRDFQQAGPELHLGLRGTAVNKRLTYEVQAEIQLPIATTVPTPLSGGSLANVELRLNLGIKVAQWLSVGYSLTAIRTPLILPEWQVVNNIMLSFTASWIR